jgi:cobalt-zinc-cadmium efflux system protein
MAREPTSSVSEPGSERDAGPSCRWPEGAATGDPGAAHGHAHPPLPQHQRPLVSVLALLLLFTLVEFVGGWLAHSLALLADAGHMLTDAGSLALSLFAMWFARRPATDAKTFGYLRLEILASLLNGVLLIGICVGIFIEAAHRLSHAPAVNAVMMVGIGGAGIAVNILAAGLLHRGAGESLNIRGAYLHVLGDLAGSLAAVLAGVIIILTGWLPADPITSVLVAMLILFSAWRLLRDSVNVLLEAVPRGIDLGELRRALDAIPGVDDVHDLHVWTLTSGVLAMSGHAVVADAASHQGALDEIHQRMREGFGIQHVAFQLERQAMYAREAGHANQPPDGGEPMPREGH